MPGNLIFNLCGSNGLCAGNTPLEAVCQGIGEVLERMVLKKIYTNPDQFPTVSDSLLTNLPSLEIKNFLESKNYQCIIKDCTISGAFPVIGLLVLDPSRTKFKFSLASDLNFDIALQRCFTELFQGFSFNMLFPISMNKIIDFDKINIFDWKTLDKNSLFQEMSNQAHNGTGYLPLEFYNNSVVVQELSAFNNNRLSNLEVFRHLLLILEKQGLNLYLKDYSYAGFPTYRVFISKASGAFQGSLRFRLNNVKIVSELHEMLKCGNIRDILNVIHTINKKQIEVNLEEIMHLKFQANYTVDLKKIEVFLEMKLNNYHEAFMLYSTYFGEQEGNDYIKLYLMSQCYKNKKINFMNYSYTNQTYLQRLKDFLNEFHAFQLPVLCSGLCSDCQNEPVCQTAKIHKIAKKLYDLYLNYDISCEDYIIKLSL